MQSTQINLLLVAIDNIDKIYNSDADWEYKYDRIFSFSKSTVYPLLDELGINLGYYDPDTTYKEDVTAYYYAIMEIKSNLEKEGY
jgi:hypothetical protein